MHTNTHANLKKKIKKNPTHTHTRKVSLWLLQEKSASLSFRKGKRVDQRHFWGKMYIL